MQIATMASALPYWVVVDNRSDDLIRYGRSTPNQGFYSRYRSSVGRYQRGADPAVMFAPHPLTQLFRTDIVPDHKSRYCGLPFSNDQICSSSNHAAPATYRNPVATPPQLSLV